MRKMILIITAAVFVLFLIVGFYKASQLQEINIQKTVTVNTDMQIAFDQVVYLKNFPEWSPFLEADPTQETTVKGADGSLGAQYHWKGNKGKDLGFQEIKEIVPLKFIKMECDIQKPFTARPIFEYTFSKVPNGVRITQDFKLKSGLMDAFFMWLFGAKADMEKMNARGMELLKISAEKKG
jgi:hypothetical protein